LRGTEISPLSLEIANEIIDAALVRSTELGFRPMTVVVIDASGDVKAVQRQDGASMFRFDVALGKAWGAVAFGTSSRDLAERAKDNPNFYSSLSSTAGGKLLPQPGAVLIKDEHGVVLGAVGASGGSGDEDEVICIHGVEAVDLSHI
jgi:uncharacterized protein GlcG (DUF336 family)